jgi:hypothetical protein
MSMYKTGIVGQVGAETVTQTQVEPAGGAALAADAIYTGARRVYGVVIDNSLNSATSYLRLWDQVGVPSIGTEDPHVILKADASTKVQYNFDVGVYFATAIKAAVVTTAGTAGATAPSGTMTISYLLGP